MEDFDLQSFSARCGAIGVSSAYGQALSEHWGKQMQVLIPDYMRYGVAMWVLFGEEQGGFLMAVVESDLFGAFERADDTNISCLRYYVQFFYNYAPSECYGSKEAAEQWAEDGGYFGRKARQEAEAE